MMRKDEYGFRTQSPITVGNFWLPWGVLVIVAVVIVSMACYVDDDYSASPVAPETPEEPMQVARSVSSCSVDVPAITARVRGYYAMGGPRWSWWQTIWGLQGGGDRPAIKSGYSVQDYVTWKAVDPATRSGPMKSEVARAKPWSGWQPVADALECVEAETGDTQSGEPQNAEPQNTNTETIEIAEGDFRNFPVADCPTMSSRVDEVVDCVDFGNEIQLRAVDDNIVWGDITEDLTGVGNIKIVEDDISYISFSSTYSWTQTANNGNVQVQMTCEQWLQAIINKDLGFGRPPTQVQTSNGVMYLEFAAGKCWEYFYNAGKGIGNIGGDLSMATFTSPAADWIPWNTGPGMVYPEVSCTWLRDNKSSLSGIKYGHRRSRDNRVDLSEAVDRLCTKWVKGAKSWSLDMSKSVKAVFTVRYGNPWRSLTYPQDMRSLPQPMSGDPCVRLEIASGFMADNADTGGLVEGTHVILEQPECN